MNNYANINRVVFLNTRVQRNMKIKKQKRKRVYKSIIIVLALFILYYGIRIVNMNIKYLGYLKDPTIFSLDLNERELHLFGKSYFIDLEIFKKNQ